MLVWVALAAWAVAGTPTLTQPPPPALPGELRELLTDRCSGHDTPMCRLDALEGEWKRFRRLTIRDERRGSRYFESAWIVSHQATLAARRVLVIGYGLVVDDDAASGAERVAAACRIVDVHVAYGEIVRAAPVPRSLKDNPDAIALFHVEIDNLLFDADNDARAAVAAADALALRVGVTTAEQPACARPTQETKQTKP